MANDTVEYLAFNRGEVSKLALARTDIKRVAMAAQQQSNFIPRVLGPMSLRPGLQHIGATKGNNQAFYLPFVFSTDDTALIELTDQSMRVWVDDALLTRPSVATAITNGNFTSDLSGWTDSDEVGGTSAWATGGFMSLVSNGTTAAIRDQQVSIASGDQAKLHAIRIVVTQGECIFRVGTVLGGTALVAETTLRPGVHSIAFTPNAANIYIRLQARLTYPTLVDSCVIDSSGVLDLPTPWGTSVLRKIRARQSGDVIFVSCEGIKQKRIERRGANSWSVVDYVANQGPFRVENASSITMAPSALNGAILLNASAPVFRPTNVGGLYYIDSIGQAVTRAISTEDTYSDPIRVTGIGSGRTFGITIIGTWTATVTLQRSVGAVGAWVDVSNYTTNVSTSLTDGLDNQIVFYRIGIKPGNYTSGSATVGLAYAAGTIRGVARVTGFVSETQVNAVVVKDFGAVTASTGWAEGAWSDRRGYPSAVGIHEGRVWWAGADKINGSVSDDFANYDDAVTGDSAPISRSIGAGPVDTINWLLEGQQLLLGAEGAELICRSTSLGEPMTPTNFNLKEVTSRGSLGVDAVKVDTSGIFVDRSGSRIFELAYDNVGSTYSANDMTEINPEIGQPGIYRMAVQRRQDTRVHAVRSDGVVALLVYNKAEDVKAWVPIITDGDIEDVVVLPGDEEDRVYYAVKRTVNGNTVRYLERWAKQSECVGATLNKQADSFIVYSGSATTTITGLGHLEGESVVCWADGSDKGTFTVSGGQIVLPAAVSNAVVGLTYIARYRSVKGQYLTRHKKIDAVALVLFDTHNRGLLIGQDFEHMDDLPRVEDFEESGADKIWEDYEYESTAVNGTFDPNARLCLQAQAPRPCTVAAVVTRRTVNA